MIKTVIKIKKTKNKSDYMVKKIATANMMTKKKDNNTNRKRKVKTKLRMIFIIELLKKIKENYKKLKN